MVGYFYEWLNGCFPKAFFFPCYTTYYRWRLAVSFRNLCIAFMHYCLNIWLVISGGDWMDAFPRLSFFHITPHILDGDLAVSVRNLCIAFYCCFISSTNGWLFQQVIEWFFPHVHHIFSMEFKSGLFPDQSSICIFSTV